MTGTAHEGIPPLVLVVDDDITLRFLMRNTLEQSGFKVEEAEDGVQALEFLERICPDIILLDVLMPRMDGFQVCASLRRKSSCEHVPVMMVTSLDDVDSIHRAYEAGATDFITKPINWAILGYRVRYMLRTSGVEKALRNAHDEMERRVRDRTVELLGANDQLKREVEERRRTEDRLKRAHEELKQSQSQLIQSAKLASIGELASGVAHELNQPLMVIRSCSQMGLHGCGEGEFGHDAFKLIEKNTLRMEKIINHLRTFSRQSRSYFQPVDVNRVVHDTFLMVGEQLRLHNIQVLMDLTPQLPSVWGDANQLEQVLLNLITNAFDAMKQGAEGSNRKNGELRIRSAPDNGNDEIVVTVSDTGPGIAPEHLGNIFDPFFTTKAVDKGTGLGLSISYGIVRKHGGEIEVSETGPHGTTLTIRLPVCRNSRDSGTNLFATVTGE